MKKLTPLLFEPIYREAIWGGDRLAKKFHRNIPSRCAESWEIADRVDGMSYVKEGPWKGFSLHDLVVQFGEQLLGRGRKDTAFPLLIKIIDAREPLSIQVHPSEDSAPLCHGEPKTEMWYVLEGGPVYASFKTPTTREHFGEAIHQNRVPSLLRKFETVPDDAVLIPGGLIHAIGAGCMMLEVQQNSNTTYRIHDWDRVGSDGKPRPLHIEPALQCIQWNNSEDPLVQLHPISDNGIVRRWSVLSTRFFTIEKWDVRDAIRVDADPNTFQIFFHLTGTQQGTTVLLPADSKPLNLPGLTQLLFVKI